MQTSSLRVVFLLYWIAAVSSQTKANDPALTTFVGEDVGLSIHVQDAKSILRDIPQAAWFLRVNELSFVKHWRNGPEFGKLKAGQVALEGLLKQPLTDFTAELFGDEVLLAIKPPVNGNQPIGVLLARATKSDSWERALKLWDQVEPHDVKSLEVSVGSLQSRQKIVRGRKEGPLVFTWNQGRIFATSEAEILIREIAARSFPPTATDGATAPKALVDTAAYRAGQDSLPRDCRIRAAINPRVWDETIRQNNADDPWTLGLWSKLTAISLGVELQHGIVLHAVVQHQQNELPDVWRQLISASESDQQIAARLPHNALLAAELRVDPRLFGWLRSLDPSEQAQRDWRTFANVSRGLLGSDFFDDVLTHIHPNYGAAIVPSTHLEQNAAPVDGLLMIGLNPTASKTRADGEPTLVDSLDGALLTFWNLAGISHNSGTPMSAAVLRRRDDHAERLRWLTGIPPFEVAYGLSADRLLLATRPELISDSRKLTADRSLATNSLFAATRSRYFAEHQNWLFLNAKAARQFVSGHRAELRNQSIYWRKLDETAATRDWDRLAELLAPFDAAFAASRVSAGEVRLTVGVVTDND